MICIGEDDPGLFLEYWQLEEETQKAKHDGYFFTGDYARKDKDGYILVMVGLVRYEPCM